MKDIREMKNAFMKMMSQVKDQAASFMSQRIQTMQKSDQRPQGKTTPAEDVLPTNMRPHVAADTEGSPIHDTQGGMMPDIERVNQDIQNSERTFNKKAA